MAIFSKTKDGQFFDHRQKKMVSWMIGQNFERQLLFFVWYVPGSEIKNQLKAARFEISLVETWRSDPN